MLGAMIDEPLHVYLESLPIPNLEIFKSATGHKQITDAYLLDLARRHDATFLTFDAKLRVLAGTRVRTEVLGS